MSEFIKFFGQSLSDNFVKLSLSGYRGVEPDLKKIGVRKIIIKGTEKLSFTYHYKTRDIVKNYDAEEATVKLKTFLPDFRNGILLTTAFDLHLENGKTKKRPATHKKAPSPDHDQKKKRQVDAARPYLHALSITDNKGNVLQSAQDKYRQIDKYIEILGGLLKGRDIKTIADMGSGKGYLTFALYDHLLDKNVKVTGVEARPDLVKLCNRIAEESGFTNLYFTEGTIQDYNASDIDVLIALHACDTATDDAILKGINAGAEVIVAAPCCHKQIRREMEKSKKKNELAALTRYGIFLERQAEMVTDTLRALYLEYAGYTTKVFEFVAGEHTAKNVMITAIKTPGGRRPETLQKINEIRDCFGISFHPLQVLLKNP